MKKIIILILSIGMCFAFASCNMFTSSNSIEGSNDSSWSVDIGGDDSSSEDLSSSADNASSEDSTLDNSGDAETQWVKVTFQQSGQVDIVKTLKKGETLTDIPTPASKTGYTVAWEPIDFTNITADVTVNAIETAKTYKLVFDANGGSLTQTTITVTYGQAYNLMTPAHDTKLFAGWMYNGTDVSLIGIWEIDADTAEVVLTAKWLNGGWTGNY